MADKNDTKIIVLAVIAAILAFIALLTVFYSIAVYTSVLTGYTSAVGEANLTISSDAAINLTTKNVLWGEGRVSSGRTYAALNTYGLVSGGNWTAVSTGMLLENIGNTNVSILLQSSKATAAAFMGGTNPVFQWNVSNNETSSCINGSYNISSFYNVNASLTVCSIMEFIDARDTIKIDFNITVPEDAPPGAKNAIITITSAAVG